MDRRRSGFGYYLVSCGGFGSFPGATVSLSRIWPSRPWMRISPPPSRPRISLARSMASRWVGKTPLARSAPGFVTFQLSPSGTTLRWFGVPIFDGPPLAAGLRVGTPVLSGCRNSTLAARIVKAKTPHVVVGSPPGPPHVVDNHPASVETQDRWQLPGRVGCTEFGISRRRRLAACEPLDQDAMGSTIRPALITGVVLVAIVAASRLVSGWFSGNLAPALRLMQPLVNHGDQIAFGSTRRFEKQIGIGPVVLSPPLAA